MEKLSHLKDFSSLRISVASPERILAWSHGEVIKPETINYRTFRAEKDGLFDERIFGPTKDYECYCGKYKRIRFKGTICDKCGVEVTRKNVRRERMGHIKLAAAVAHAWYFRGIPSKLGLLLDISPRLLESVIYFSRYMVISVDYATRAKVIAELEAEQVEKLGALKKVYDQKETEEREDVRKKIEEVKDKSKEQHELIKEELLLRSRRHFAEFNEQFLAEASEIEKQYQATINLLEKIEDRTILSEDEYFLISDYLSKFAKVGMGAESVREVLSKIDLNKLSESLALELTQSSGQKKVKIIKRIGVVESLRAGGVRPEWMVFTVLPVIPPDLRPMVQLEGGRFAASDLNDLYRAVLNRNNRLKRLLDLGAPEIIVRNEKRMLQEAVDALIDSGKVQRNRVRRGKQPLKSLTDMLKGKQGRFRQNLLGKRVDYSGRSVIVAGPSLYMHETGLPKEMALELFKPFVIREILMDGHAPNPKSAKYFLEGRSREVWDALEKVVTNYPVLLNRAPTLHRLGILAFYPRLIEGNAIQLHPCVCSGFNADFDGDQMSVHVPLSRKARLEARELMLASKNLLKPADGDPIAVPVKEMALGTYFLTSIDNSLPMYPNQFSDADEAKMAYESDLVGLRQPLTILLDDALTETTVGRLIFNEILPQSLRFHNDIVDKKVIKRLVNQCILNEEEGVAVNLIDDIKKLGFKFSTFSGVSVSIFDNVISPQRDKVIQEAENRALEISSNYKRGLITRKEKTQLLQGVWTNATHELDVLTWDELGEDNDVKIVVSAGASRASREQVKQLGGMKGLVYDVSGNVVELPIKSNFRGGLSGMEYFTGTRAARKSLADTALKTADSGYLTRKLVDVAQEILVRDEDCGAKEGFTIRREQKVALSSFSGRLFGRVLSKSVTDGAVTIAKKGALISREVADQIEKSGVSEVEVFSPLTCESIYGVCQKCYGYDLALRKMVSLGSPVGVIAAQSIGEPGTQLTLRTFHTGGIVGKDITQGLPRITELFEARTPKFKAITTEVAGKVSLTVVGEDVFVRIIPSEGKNEAVEYKLPRALDVRVKEGDLVAVGSPLTEGYLDPKDCLHDIGLRETQRYLLEEVQYVYSSQGVEVNDKHVEVILKQMFNKVQVEDPRDSHFFPGDLISKEEWQISTGEIKKKGGQPARVKQIILGITRSALRTDSFLAAASFQETSRVLTEAAMSGKVDRLRGLKENVILGRRIPVKNIADEMSESEEDNYAND